MKWVFVIFAVVAGWFAYWLGLLHRAILGTDHEWMHKDWPGWEQYRPKVPDEEI